MTPFEDACPFDAAARASRCQTCCNANTLPPCAAAYLRGAAGRKPANVISLFRVEAEAPRKAA